MKILGFRRDAGQTEGATGPECDRQFDKQTDRQKRQTGGQGGQRAGRVCGLVVAVEGGGSLHVAGCNAK